MNTIYTINFVNQLLADFDLRTWIDFNGAPKLSSHFAFV